MSVIGLGAQEIRDTLKLVAAIMHLGNITFEEDRSGFANVQDEQCNNKTKTFSIVNSPSNTEYLIPDLDFPAYLLDIDPQALKTKLISRIFESNRERLDMTLNVEQVLSDGNANSCAVDNPCFANDQRAAHPNC